MNGLITPIDGRKKMDKWGYNPTYAGYNPTFITGRGPPRMMGLFHLLPRVSGKAHHSAPSGWGMCCWYLINRLLVGGFNPSEKICSSNWIISPGRDEDKKYLKPPPRLGWIPSVKLTFQNLKMDGLENDDFPPLPGGPKTLRFQPLIFRGVRPLNG